jgi:hypothetical protein
MPMIYINHVREGLAELASEALQTQLWLASDGPWIGSFDEAVEQTYSDSGLGDALDKSLAAEIVGVEAVKLLLNLRRALHSVDRTLKVEDLIASPAMREVRRVAKGALDEIKYTGPSATVPPG